MPKGESNSMGIDDGDISKDDTKKADLKLVKTDEEDDIPTELEVEAVQIESSEDVNEDDIETSEELSEDEIPTEIDMEEADTLEEIPVFEAGPFEAMPVGELDEKIRKEEAELIDDEVLIELKRRYGKNWDFLTFDERMDTYNRESADAKQSINVEKRFDEWLTTPDDFVDDARHEGLQEAIDADTIAAEQALFDDEEVDTAQEADTIEELDSKVVFGQDQSEALGSYAEKQKDRAKVKKDSFFGNLWKGLKRIGETIRNLEFKSDSKEAASVVASAKADTAKVAQEAAESAVDFNSRESYLQREAEESMRRLEEVREEKGRREFQKLARIVEEGDTERKDWEQVVSRYEILRAAFAKK